MTDDEAARLGPGVDRLAGIKRSDGHIGRVQHSRPSVMTDAEHMVGLGNGGPGQNEGCLSAIRFLPQRNERGMGVEESDQGGVVKDAGRVHAAD